MKPQMKSSPSTSGIKPPAIGLPEGVKDQGRRVDFREDDFKLLIETKGIRVGWARAAVCPCIPINSQTEQPNPNCSLCQETPGWLYFRPQDYAVPTSAGSLDSIQQAALERYNGAIVRAVTTGAGRNFQPFNRQGEWAFGSFMMTLRSENRVSFMDRFVFLDTTVAWSELHDVDASGFVKLRYPARYVNLIRSEAQRWEEGIDFELSDDGNIQFRAGKEPAPDTRVTVNYLHHPVALVMEHQKAWRDSLKEFKTAAPKTPLGDPQQLPVLVACKMEYALGRT